MHFQHGDFLLLYTSDTVIFLCMPFGRGMSFRSIREEWDIFVKKMCSRKESAYYLILPGIEDLNAKTYEGNSVVRKLSHMF